MTPRPSRDLSLADDAPAYIRWAIYLIERVGLPLGILLGVCVFGYQHGGRYLSNQEKLAQEIVETQKALVKSSDKSTTILDELRAGQQRDDTTHAAQMQGIEAIRRKIESN